MKKKSTLVFMICVMLLVSALWSCKSAKQSGSDSTVETLDRIYEENDISDYDENGEIILSSSEYRQVYYTDYGTYLIVIFGDSGPSGMTIVKDFGTSDAALEYMMNDGKELAGSGEYTNVNLNGKYVTYSPTLGNEKYGIYYTMSKSQAEAELASKYVKQ